MKKSILILTLSVTGSVVGCGGGSSAPQPPQVAPATAGTANSVGHCDSFRNSLAHDEIKRLGLDLMMRQMRKVSRALSQQERIDLANYDAILADASAREDMRMDANLNSLKLYSDAIEQARILEGRALRMRGIGRTIEISTSLALPIQGGYRALAKSETIARQAPVIGDIAEAYLAVRPDQRRYKYILQRVVGISTGTDGSTTVLSTPVSLSQHIESKLPAYCVGVPTNMPAEQLDTVDGFVPAIGAL